MPAYARRMGRNTGTILILVGLAVALVGVLVWVGAFSWFGRLPGDIDPRGETSRAFIPITSMIVVSVALTLIVNVGGRFLR
jgi:hypothetical protein